MTVFRSQFNDFLFYVFNSNLFAYQSGTFLTSTINQLTIANLKSIVVPIPPSKEQIAITHFLDRNTTEIDTLISGIRRAIDHLGELRTAIISAAVTGKIDVRMEAA